MCPHFKRPLALALALLLTGGPAIAATTSTGNPAALERRVTISVAGLALQDAIRLVAQKGRLNMVIEDDLPQLVNVEFKDVRLGDALDTLFAMGGVQAVWSGDIFAVIGRRKAFQRGLLAANARVFTLKYASAQRVAEFLNTTALVQPYEQSRTGGSTQNSQDRLELARADARTNSLIVMGTQSDLAVAERTVAALDHPQLQRIFKLSHASAVDVAQLLNATLFNNGNKSPVSEQIRADVGTLIEGVGGSTTGGAIALSGSQTSIRARTEATQQIAIESRQSIAVPDSRTNSVIVMGSHETLAQAAVMIPQLDKKLVQVAIEVEVMEMNTQDALELGTTLTAGSGAVSTTFDASPTAATPGWTIGYDPTAPVPAFRARLNALVRDRKARLLAHPTIIASDNTESQINIVDEVIKGTRVSNQGLSANGQNLLVVEPIFGAAGVTLNILPRIGSDNQVTLRLHPTVSSVRETQRDSSNNLISLLSRRELVAQQVVVRSGTSLTIGGLTQANRINSVGKLPIIGDIPIIGQIFSNLSNQQSNTELMILVTPRIVKD